MPRVIARNKTSEICPECHSSKLLRILEEWDAFPESGPQYIEKMACEENCGYTRVLRDDMNMVGVGNTKPYAQVSPVAS